MIKKKFLNPGAYVIFIKQLKNDGLFWDEIGEIMGTNKAYPQSVVQGKSNPKYTLLTKSAFYTMRLKSYNHIEQLAGLQVRQRTLHTLPRRNSTKRRSIGILPSSLVIPLAQSKVFFGKTVFSWSRLDLIPLSSSL